MQIAFYGLAKSHVYIMKQNALVMAIIPLILITATDCLDTCGYSSMCSGALYQPFTCNCQTGYQSPTNDGKKCSLVCSRDSDCGSNAICYQSSYCQCNGTIGEFTSTSLDGANCVKTPGRFFTVRRICLNVNIMFSDFDFFFQRFNFHVFVLFHYTCIILLYRNHTIPQHTIQHRPDHNCSVWPYSLQCGGSFLYSWLVVRARLLAGIRR